MKKSYRLLCPLNLIIFLSGALVSCLVYLGIFLTAADSLRTPENIPDVSVLEQVKLQKILEKNYPENTSLLKDLSYESVKPDFKVDTNSVILIDAKTGAILFQQNPDKIIPPASMTKLVEMYVVFEAIERGDISLDDIVPLPPESWAKNLPSDASIMFLAQGQTVTLNELLLGLAIASGNDASIAVANYVCGNMDDFVARMNAVVEGLGLKNTHFVESSGYSELNLTTPREFASFCKVYLEKFPWALEKYHSQTMLAYPLEHNLPSYEKYKGDSSAVIQYNTNKLLGKLPGCDGLKTGFINESGYNLALTCQRYGNRFIAVMMRGPGRGSAEGNKYRIADGTALMEFAFANYADYQPAEEHNFIVPVLGGKEKGVFLVPALDECFTVPKLDADSPTGAASSIRVKAQVPDYLEAGITMGKEYGSLSYYLGDTLLRTVPLVARQDVEEGNFWSRFIGLVAKEISYIHSL